MSGWLLKEIHMKVVIKLGLTKDLFEEMML
jgi:hypothetical protein